MTETYLLPLNTKTNLLGLIVGGSNKMHQGENHQDFLKWGVAFRLFSYNN